MPAGPGISSSANAGPRSPLIFGILGALIVIGILWFANRYFGDGSVRSSSPSASGGITDGTLNGKGDGSIRENPLINEQLQSADGSNNFVKLTPQGSHNFMKEVFDSDGSFGDSLLDDGSGPQAKK